MSIHLLNFERRFEVWVYSVSHAQLMLRGNRSETFTTRIDVLFKGVAAINLPTIFDGFLVTESTGDEVRELNLQLGSNSLVRQRTFIIRGQNFAGHVVALAMFWHEDSGFHYDESFFQKSFFRVRI
jgi:hypothetical protein